MIETSSELRNTTARENIPRLFLKRGAAGTRRRFWPYLPLA
jgi:hypothetical protein